MVEKPCVQSLGDCACIFSRGLYLVLPQACICTKLVICELFEGSENSIQDKWIISIHKHPLTYLKKKKKKKNRQVNLIIEFILW